MATRSYIIVKSKGDTKIVSSLGFGQIIVRKNTPYIFAYCHNKVGINELGKELVRKYNSYGKAIELVSNGDMECIGSYYTSNKFAFDSCKPFCVMDLNKTIKQYTCVKYFYVFENDNWYLYTVAGGKTSFFKNTQYYRGSDVVNVGMIKDLI